MLARIVQAPRDVPWRRPGLPGVPKVIAAPRTAGRRRRWIAVTALPGAALALVAVLVVALTQVAGSGATVNKAAAAVLNRAARVAAQTAQPVPRPDQWIAVIEVSASLISANPGSRTAQNSLWLQRTRLWWPANPGRMGVEWQDGLRNERLPWSPRSVQHMRLGVSWTPIPPAGCPGGPPPRFTYKFLTTLPTSPARLRTWIYAHKNGGQGANDQAWTDITDLLGTALTPPRLTAALFNVAATIPGAAVVPHVSDAAGRPGIAVSRIGQAGTEAEQLIFSASTYRLLGGRVTLAMASKGMGPAGTAIDAWALLGKTVVNHLPQRHSRVVGASGC